MAGFDGASKALLKAIDCRSAGLAESVERHPWGCIFCVAGVGAIGEFGHVRCLYVQATIALCHHAFNAVDAPSPEWKGPERGWKVDRVQPFPLGVEEASEGHAVSVDGARFLHGDEIARYGHPLSDAGGQLICRGVPVGRRPVLGPRRPPRANRGPPAPPRKACAPAGAFFQAP
jgi:hypothetical protein